MTPLQSAKPASVEATELVDFLFAEDIRTNGHPAVPAECLESARNLLIRAMFDGEALEAHLAQLGALYGDKFPRPRARRFLREGEKLARAPVGSMFRHRELLDEQLTSRLAELGPNALQNPEELARLLLNPFGLWDLADLIDATHPPGWLDAESEFLKGGVCEQMAREVLAEFMLQRCALKGPFLTPRARSTPVEAIFMRLLSIPKGIFNAVCYSPDGKYLLGIHSGWRLRVWEVADYTECITCALPGTLYSHDTLALAGDLAVLTRRVYDFSRLWEALDQPSKRPIKTKGLIDVVSLEPAESFAHEALCTNGREIVKTYHDYRNQRCNISFWGLDCQRLRTVYLPFVQDQHAALSPDGRLLAHPVGHEVQLYQMNGKLDWVLSHTDQVKRMAFSPNGKWLATGAGRSLWLWDLASKVGERFPAFRSYVSGVAFAPSGPLLAAVDNVGEFRLIDANTRRQQTCLQFEIGGVYDLAFSPNGMTIAGAGRKNAVLVWDVE